MKKFILSFRIFLLVIICVYSSGCCTLFLGSKQEIEVRSSPEGAKVYDSRGTYYGKTPLKTKFPRREVALVLKKEGYETEQLSTDRSFAWFPFCLNWIVLPFVVDLVAHNHFYIEDEYFMDVLIDINDDHAWANIIYND